MCALVKEAVSCVTGIQENIFWEALLLGKLAV